MPKEIEVKGGEPVIQFDVTESWINEFRTQSSLVLKDKEDSETYQLIKSYQKIAVSKRLEVEKKRKELNEDALKWQRTVNAEAKRITALLEPIEEHLNEQKKIYEEELERKKNLVLIARRDELLAIGFIIQNGVLVHPKTSIIIHGDTLKAMTDIAFQNELERWRSEIEAILKAEKEEQERKQAEELRLAEERAAIEKERAEMEAMRLELQRLKAEAERKAQEELAEQQRLEQQKIEEQRQAAYNTRMKAREIRVGQLKELGFEEMVARDVFYLPIKFGNPLYSNYTDWADKTDSEFEAYLEHLLYEFEMRSVVARDTKAAYELKIQQELLEKQRLAEEQERIRKEEEQSNMKDTELFKSYIDGLLNVPIPAMKTKSGAARISKLIALIKSA